MERLPSKLIRLCVASAMLLACSAPQGSPAPVRADYPTDMMVAGQQQQLDGGCLGSSGSPRLVFTAKSNPVSYVAESIRIAFGTCQRDSQFREASSQPTFTLQAQAVRWQV